MRQLHQNQAQQGERKHAQNEAKPLVSPRTLSVYLHWPFCAQKCPYCDFNVHVRDRSRGALDQEAWHVGFRNAIEAAYLKTGPRVVTSIYFGGGTPSMMPIELVSFLIQSIRERWADPSFEEDTFSKAAPVEITLEANPSDIFSLGDRLQDWRAAGVNRLSLGVQSFSDPTLKALGRTHSGAEAYAAAQAIAACFPRWTLDLMTALPTAFDHPWQNDIETALRLQPRHLSVYQLTIEHGTIFEAQARAGALCQLQDDDAAQHYTETARMLAAGGLEPYEISNYCYGRKDWSLHNSSGWQYHDYVGIGPGAHGRLTYEGEIHATRQHRAPELWLQRARSADQNFSNGQGFETHATLSREEAVSEWIMSGLRMTQGITFSTAVERFRCDPKQIINLLAAKHLAKDGWITLSEDGLQIRQKGRLVLNEILRQLLC